MIRIQFLNEFIKLIFIPAKSFCSSLHIKLFYKTSLINIESFKHFSINIITRKLIYKFLIAFVAFTILSSLKILIWSACILLYWLVKIIFILLILCFPILIFSLLRWIYLLISFIWRTVIVIFFYFFFFIRLSSLKLFICWLILISSFIIIFRR
jgi:hypothetical protein